MKNQDWYSAKIRLAVLIEGQGAVDYSDSVYLFRSTDFESAFYRALAIGRTCEREYLNADKKRVRSRLKEIISLDIVTADDLDGAEVYSEPVALEEGAQIPFDATFNPERSRPTQTI
jgi:hypothetical protein